MAAVGLCAAVATLLAGTLHARLARHTAAIRNKFDPDAAFPKGLGQLLANDRFGAEATFREMLAYDPRDVEAALYLGLVLREHGDRHGSRKVLKSALRMDLARTWTREIHQLLSPPKI